MKAPRIPSILAIVLASVIVVVAGGRAKAWVAWGPVWPQHNTTYDSSSMGSSWRPVADFGADQWTDVPTSDWVYTSDNSSANDITTGTIDGAGAVLATTTIYYSGGTINRATIKFDSAENWYLGSGAPGSSQIDGRSVSAHEFGHALGLDHTQSSNCPSGSGRATMCSSYPVGSSYMRSLEGDDQDGVSTLYPDNGTATPTQTPSVTPTPSITLTPTSTPGNSIGMPGGGPTDTPTITPPATATQTPPPPTASATATAVPSSSPEASNTPTTPPTSTPRPTRTPGSCIGC